MTTLYTKPGCGSCIATYRELDKKGIQFVSVDVTKNPEAFAKLQELDMLQMPVVEAPNGELWSGFRPDKINELALGAGGE